jgi:hypothetical protein
LREPHSENKTYRELTHNHPFSHLRASTFKTTVTLSYLPWSKHLSPSLNPFRSIATAAAVWAIVGVPVAAVIAAFRVFVWVIFSLPEMVGIAAVLGAAQGLGLYLIGRPSQPGYGKFRWFGPVSGGILGLLGFPPVFSRINGVVADRLMVAVSLLAAVCGGIAAGFASARVVVVLQGRRSTLGRSVLVGCLLVLPLAALDYHFYWPPTADRLPVSRVSHQAITNFSAGDARGSTWAGCYQYLGQYSRGSGVVGGEGGLLEVGQTNGSLKVFNGSAYPLLGGVDGNGRFRFGAEATTGQDTLRVLWEGKFNDNYLDFTRRMTVLRGINILNTTRLTGTAQRISCNR